MQIKTSIGDASLIVCC